MDNKATKLIVNRIDGKIDIVVGRNYFFDVESIQTQIYNKQDIICFGYYAIQRELIESFRFELVGEK
ncbi:hypothetical protein FDF96_04890 [Clostridium botulinum]|uniref:Uncharacterized protein n=1 Tax=Clostridium botulinum D str. 1873 TaxID=592027 RepID=A0A9P2G5G5_CLOBO|nr:MULTISPECIES: hypothetical protein [Clostridium]EES90346.1 hypothetical protein CLG_B2305 [Clostridium phage D-1873]MCD3217974.1 hypothetical protein [Clostridium botulinum C]NFV19213.1 hypothetical protein [Clostridium botulinum]NFV48077.1 hypothetical protein [Clostridium botulinum]QPW56470.1 hypothetical protein IRP61_11380 [Clostridium botulinum]